MINFTNYMILFFAGQILLAPGFILLKRWQNRYSDYGRQRIFLITLVIIGLLLPIPSLSGITIKRPNMSEKVLPELKSNSILPDSLSSFGSGKNLPSKIMTQNKYSAPSGKSSLNRKSVILIPEIIKTGLLLICPLFLCIGLCLFLTKYFQHSLYLARIRKSRENRNNTSAKENITLVYSSLIETPFSAGILYPAIYLPSGTNSSDLPLILKHESCHIKKNHILWNTLFEVYASLFWFYPQARSIRNLNYHLQELITDRMLADSESNTVFYARLLLQYASRLSKNSKQPVLQSGVVSNTRFTERISCLLNPGKGGTVLCERILELFLICLCAGGSFFAIIPVSAQETEIILKNETITESTPETKKMETGDRSQALSPERFLLELNEKIENDLDKSPKMETSDTVKRTHWGQYYAGDISAVINKIRQENPESIPHLFPLENRDAILTQSYGKHEEQPIFGKTDPYWFHTGVDYAVPVGTPVIASGDGVVTETGYLEKGRGHYVIIRHHYGISSFYGHLDEIKINAGDSVNAGDIIGLSGNTGLSTGPHLHFGISLTPIDSDSNNSIFVDPHDFLEI